MNTWVSKDGSISIDHVNFRASGNVIITKAGTLSPLTINTDILMDFVAEIVRKNAISKLKAMETDELLTVQINYQDQP